MQTTGKRRIDRITSASYLDGLAHKPMPDVRSIRDECDDEETELSFERRLLQGRIDILEAELHRRDSGGAPLIEQLATILSDEGPLSTRGSIPRKDPVIDFDRPKRRVEKLISDDSLASLPDLTTDEVRRIVDTLREAERDVSKARHAVQHVLDVVKAEIGRRYKSGEADPSDVLTP